jgi:hypothetical protein
MHKTLKNNHLKTKALEKECKRTDEVHALKFCFKKMNPFEASLGKIS